jgi:hypothetical protein
MAVSVLQNRPRITTSAIKPQWSRINPKTGFKRLAPPQLLFESRQGAREGRRGLHRRVPRDLAAAPRAGRA